MTLKNLRELLARYLPQDGRPVVAYSGLFAIARALPVESRALPSALLDVLLDAVGARRTLLMPTYTNGYRDGFLDLDTEPGNTGMINETLRRKGGTWRTASAFWSFAARGPEAGTLGTLRPRDAWGEGSLFEWIQTTNAHVLALGVPWCMCSFLHRAEWLAQVPYRYLKEFSGTISLRGRREPLRERLFVRSLEPKAQNVWPRLDDLLATHGMQRVALGRGQVAEIGAQNLIQAVLSALQRDPLAFVRDPETLRIHFFPETARTPHGH